ncbi:type II secretion system secretin GspD [soil metagenome]
MQRVAVNRLSMERSLAAIVVAVHLGGCSARLAGDDLLTQKLQPQKAASRQSVIGDDGSLGSRDNRPRFMGEFRPGTDQFTGPGQADPTPEAEDSDEITLNLVDVSIQRAAKTILSEVMEANYSVDGRVQGTVTLQTTKPLSRRAVLRAFETVLRENGAALVEQRGVYRVVPAAEGSHTIAPLETDIQEPARPGVRSYIIPLHFVSAEEIRTVLASLVPESVVLRTDAARNMIILSGSDQDIATLRETISIFDVDWMRGMSFALVPLKTSDPAAIAGELETIFDTRNGPSKGMIRFIPNKRLGALLVISSRAHYLREASNWIRKLDTLAGTRESELHVYQVQNRTASDLARVLQSVYRSENGAKVAVEGGVAPKLETAVVTSGEPPIDVPPTAEASEERQTSQAGPEAPGIRVVPDDANNALLIVSTDAEYDRMLRVLGRIDAMPNQVLLEAVIAEVTLDDDLRFGVRWFFGKDDNHGTFSDVASGAVSSTFPGFSYFLKANDISAALNALSSVTDVRVLSAPSLMVLDNHTAVLQVGDQVPIVTQSATSVSAPGAPVVNEVELKDTGVILSVTPRVNDSGRVILDIEQEVSSVVKTTTSGIDSPTIRQRKVKTSVATADGEALALGGLIQERENTTKTKVPVLGDIPLLGNAFRSKENSVARTELIIFIRPRVIRDLNEARQVTEEFRRQLSISAPRVRRGDPRPGEEFIRTIE